MSLRNVTLTAVAALSFGMAADAQQTRTITVPMNEPGAAAPAPSGPGTTVTRTPDGATTVESTGTVPRPAATGAPAADAGAAAATTAGTGEAGNGSRVEQTGVAPLPGPATEAPAAEEEVELDDSAAVATQPAEAPASDAGADAAQPAADAAGAATEAPAPAAGPEEAATTAATGTAAAGTDTDTPVPTTSPGEPPAAPKEGLPLSSTEEQVTAPVPTAEGAAEENAPGAAPADVAAETPADAAAEPEAPAAEGEAATGGEAAPAEEAEQVEPSSSDAGVTTEPTEEAAAEEAPAQEAAAEEAPAQEAEAQAAPAEASAASHEQHITDVAFSFEGPFGSFDQFQLQRGLQVYTEVCSACHGLRYVPLRTLSDPGGPGLPEDQVRAYAAEMSVTDADTGEERPRLPTDHFPTVSGEGMGPDLSLMAKARAGFHGPYGTGMSQLVNGMGGPEYIYSILNGYTGEEREEAGSVLYENTAFPGGWISMAPPLSDDQVTFADGAPADLASMSEDVAAFLMWTAEPKMMARKQAGLVSVLFLIVLTSLLYLTNKRLWWPLKHGRDVVGDDR